MAIYLGNRPVKDIVFVPSTIVDNIAVAQAPVQVNKIAQTNSIGEVVRYVDVSFTSSFDYVYHIINLTYITEVKNDIYGLHYDLLGNEQVVAQINTSYTYEGVEKTYSWF